MTLDTANARAYGDTLCRVYTAPLGGAVAPTSPTSTLTGYYDFGLTADSGFVEGYEQQSTIVYAHQGGVPVRELRSQTKETWTVDCLETNPVVLGLLNPTAVITTPTAGTNEVQTLTTTGTLTAGSYPLAFRGQTATLAYNALAAAIQAALEALSTVGTGNVTVTGTSPTFTVTFLGSLAAQDVPLLATSSAGLTGGTIAATVATPGVNAIYLHKTRPSTAANNRLFVIDKVDGSRHTRKYLPNGEARRAGTITSSGGGLDIAQFVITAFPDSAGDTVYTITDDPAYRPGVFV